jgi:alpha-L-rhamnosidase
MALRFGLLPEESRPEAAAKLVKAIEARDGCLSTGFLGVNLLLPTLTDIGRTDWAWKLLLNRRYPSWLYSVDQGATTMWERWNSYTIENGFGNPAMNSFNHYAYGSAGEWMFGGAAGIAPETPGYKSIVIRPLPGGGLSFVRASYNSIRGPIETEWRIAGEDLELKVTIPANASATVYVPAASAGAVTESDGPAAAAAGVKFLRMEPGAAVYEIGSGSYAFRSKDAKKLLPTGGPAGE